MTDQTQSARQIAIDAGVLTPCPSCGGIHRTEVDPAEGYKLANLGFSQGLYRDTFPDRRALTDAVKGAIEGADKMCERATTAAPPAAPTTPAKPVAPIITKPAPVVPARPAAPPTTPRDAAIAAVPPERREHLLTRASDLGVTRVDDVLWGLVKAVVDTEAASEKAVAAMAAMKDAESTIPAAVLRSVQAAGSDLSAGLTKDLQEEMTRVGQAIFQAVEIAEKRGAVALEAAASDLDKSAQAKGDDYIKRWQADVAKATAATAKAHLSSALAARWGSVAGVVLVAFLIGTAVGGLLMRTVSPTLSEVGAEVVGRQVLFPGARGAGWCRPGVLCVKPGKFALRVFP